VSFYLPRFLVFAVGLIVFLVGLRLRKQERKRREIRKQQMLNLVNSVTQLHSATQAMGSLGKQPSLGRLQDQQVQSRSVH